MGKVLFCALALSFSIVTNADPIAVHGLDLNYDYPNFMDKLAEIWQFASQDIAHLGPGSELAPEIYFENFDRTTESKDLVAFQNEWLLKNPAVWLEWVTLKGITPDQITPEYVQAHIAELFPFPKTFRGFHYQNTNRIQINPESTFLPFYVNDPYGMQKDTVGYGFYVTGHEMTHLALSNKGVPEILHHCIYVTSIDNQPSLMKRMADILAAKSIASSIVEHYGLEPEIELEPCKHLNQTQRDEAVRYARRLAPGGVYTSKALISLDAR